MDAAEHIKRFQEFLEANYHAELMESIRKGKNFLAIDFAELSKFDIEVATDLLETPEEVIKAAEIAVEQFDTPIPISNFRVRIHNLPESQTIMIRNIRSKHIGKLLLVDGTVRQKSDVRPQVTAAKFECPACGNVLNVLQLDQKFKEPTRCSCGRKGKFRQLSKELIDAQGIVLEEATENLDGGEQPKRMNIFLKEDLVSPISDKKTNPGTRIQITGFVKEVPIIMRNGSQSTRFDLLIEANYVRPVIEDFSEVLISKEDEDQITQISQDPKLYSKLVESAAPSIYGYDKIKEAILYQLAGGVKKVRTDGIITRGDIHILLIGDPGAGKSQLLKRAAKISPKARFVSGKGASGAGLTAAVVKDEFLGGWSLEAGALVLANKGLCCTTEDSEFIMSNGKLMSFKELFSRTTANLIFPKFKILGLNKKNLKIESFEIKQAFKIKNNKKLFHIKTRTGRSLNLTEDNEILICERSKIKWKQINSIKNGEYIAVPKNIKLNKKDKYSKDFSYISGLIASDGHIKINSKNATTRFYNTNEFLIKIFKEKLKKLKISYSTYIQKKGRKSIIRGKEVISKKDLYSVYNSKKSFAKKIISFGIKSGNKSITHPLNNKILTYSDSTISNFIKGIFDGNGSIRKNPYEITLTTGILKNAILFQKLLLRLSIISSIKKSTNSWHCDIRGKISCIDFFNKIGSNHPEKFKKLEKINLLEAKDRIDILPNHQLFFKKFIKENSWKLGKNKYKYFWNYSKKNVNPSKYRLNLLNKLLEDEYLQMHIDSDILWDKIISIKEIKADYVYDFTMKKTDNFIANDIIMHNCIDELDKMSVDDRSAMHEALEGQTITISKANIQATLRAETTVLAAANPKFGRFDPYEILAKQINLPPALISRFDLIFPIKDLPDEKKDNRMASFILEGHKNPDTAEPEIDTATLKKYLAYVRKNIKPKLTDEAIEEIKTYYVQMRNSTNSEEVGMKTVTITTRQLEALVRLSEAASKMRLGKEVTKKDAKRAIDLLNFCLIEVGLDPETGKIDIDRITSGISSSARNKISNVKEIITELEAQFGKTIPIEEIVKAAKEKGLQEDEVEEVIDKLKRGGDIFEPRRGLIQRL